MPTAPGLPQVYRPARRLFCISQPKLDMTVRMSGCTLLRRMTTPSCPNPTISAIPTRSTGTDNTSGPQIFNRSDDSQITLTREVLRYNSIPRHAGGRLCYLSATNAAQESYARHSLSFNYPHSSAAHPSDAKLHAPTDSSDDSPDVLDSDGLTLIRAFNWSGHLPDILKAAILLNMQSLASGGIQIGFPTSPILGLRFARASHTPETAPTL
ncbi:hypothetical protein NMY22_g2588 [Coprinellus aureogranulatus]|nr:hypothetical protein NMY22_g2588 [Coprinellus aureogranulatus]